jgi:phosphoglycolate phosphatase-like HAD superfamily hydrolase/tRNA(Arg) A34 adenosine deaminase TadA
MSLDAMIFDLDGTLVDTNSLHIEAWRRAFESLDYKIAPDRIFREVGKGGDTLVPAILGEEADRRGGDALRAAHPREFKRLISQAHVRLFPRARELLAALRGREIRCVLATSSARDQVEAVERSAEIDLSSMVDAIVTADDADRSKPLPDLIVAAVRKVEMSAAQCAMVGDTPYDAQACLGAGVVCLGVLTGGHQASTLIGSGARAVWRDTGDLLEHLDDALRIASPGSLKLTQATLEQLMREAMNIARDGAAHGEAPIGCALFRGDGTLIAAAHNEMNASGNKTAHAEIVAFARAAGRCPLDCRDMILVSTLEPCVMCTGAAMEAAVDTIVYALKAPADSGTGRVRPPHSPESQMPRIVGDVLREESRKMFEEWMTRPGLREEQVAYVKQLLALNP